KNQNVKKLLLVLLAIFAAFLVSVAILFAVGVAKGFREAARRGGSEAAIERRLAEEAKRINATLPGSAEGGVRLDSVVAGPGARRALAFHFVCPFSARLKPHEKVSPT